MVMAMVIFLVMVSRVALCRSISKVKYCEVLSEWLSDKVTYWGYLFCAFEQEGSFALINALPWS